MKRFALILIFFSLLLPAAAGTAEAATTTLAGRVLLQVESRGEAWYVSPLTLTRYYLGRPLDAFNLMRQLSLGVSNHDFDSWNGIAPSRLAGRFLIKPQDFGRAYYVYPPTRRLYYLGRPADAFDLMGRLGLGISNVDLARLAIAPSSAIAPAAVSAGDQTSQTEKYFPTDAMERAIFKLVNDARLTNGLAAVAWDSRIAAVAREHSQNLATENFALIDENKICTYPFIHHEGTVFGLHHSERLNNRQIYNFSSSAENIALIPLVKSTSYISNQNELPVDCQAKLDQLNQTYETKIKILTDEAEIIAAVKSEVAKRAELLSEEKTIRVTATTWYGEAEVEKRTADGWMNSPGHRANILNADYTDAGLGITRVKDYIIITQVFVKNSACGYNTGPCCERTGFYPYCYVPLECTNLICQ
jgi:uncharacterized protein YkwD